MFIKKLKRFFNHIPREYIVFFLFIFGGLVLISKVFSYTILDYKYYKNLADKQQIGKVEIPVTRGNIYSKNPNILATSLNLNDLAVDPTMPGNKIKLMLFLRDIVYDETCKNKTKKECYENILKFVKKLEIKDFKYDEKYIKNLILDTIKNKLSNLKVTSVLLVSGLSENKQKSIKNLGLSGVYVNNGNLYVNPEEVVLPDLVAEKLSKFIDIPEPRIKYLIRKRIKRYIPIIKKLSIQENEKLDKYLKEEKKAIKSGILSEENSIYKFIILTPYPQRYYPEKKLASQVIGFIDNAGVGHYGLEGYFNDILKGNKGFILAKKDIKGRTINPISLELGGLYGEGAQIYTTIDRNIQKKVEEFLEAGVKKFRANKGTVVIMNPKTGEIIAMANYPSYDPNNPGNVYELEKVSYSKYPNPLEDLKGIDLYVVDSKNGKDFIYNGKKIKLRKATQDEIGNPAIVKYKFKNNFGAGVYVNDAISSLYEPGSIMKPITVAIGLDSGEITKYSKYEDKGKVTIDNFTISNVSRKCLGYHTFGHALNFSCNVGMLKIAKKYGKAIAYEYLNKFGFGRPTGINLEGEVYKPIDSYEKWSRARLFTSSYGLGISVTPLQMAVAYSALVNGGVYVKPHIVDKIIYPNGKILKYKTEIDHRVIKESTSREITRMLVDSINNGVAKSGNVEGYTLGGKTGTSQIAVKGGYDKGVASTNGSFVGFGPAQDPKFVVIVKLERPRTSIYGGATSSHIFHNIAKFLLEYYNIPKNTK